jgi:farnesyl-diphosphate farnesyltransferase
MNKAVNPRDVSYVFREHTRSIHSKVAKDDPNLLKLSIACAKVCRFDYMIQRYR